MEYYLGIDCGTQGTKAVIMDGSSGVIVGKGYATHSIIAKDDGTREQDASWWIDALCSAVHDAIAKSQISPEEVKAIAVSGQQHGLVLLDENGNVIRNVKLWNDTSTSRENDEIIHEAGGLDAVWKKIGTAFPVGFTASKVRYVIEHDSDIWNKTSHVLLPHDYLNYWLSGSYGTEESEVSGTGYYDVINRRYSEEMMNIIDPSGRLSRSVPPVIEWNKPLGTLRKEAAEILGLPAGIPIAPGGGDNTMGAIGTSAIVEGRSALSLGTSGTVCFRSSSKKEEIDKLLQVYTVMGSSWLVTCCTLNATNATTSVQEMFGLDLNELDEAMGNAAIGSGGVLMAQYLGGERMPPIPHAKAVIKGLTTNNMTKENIIRATAESVIFTLWWGFEKMKSSFSVPDELIITGGGGNSAPWRKIVADVFNMPVRCLVSDEGGALGAAIQAEYMYAHLSGEDISLEKLCKFIILFDDSKTTYPDLRNHELYMEVFREWKKMVSKEYNVTM